MKSITLCAALALGVACSQPPVNGVTPPAAPKSITLSAPPNSRYPAEGKNSLIDGRLGSDYYQDSEWMGYWYQDKPFVATIDLGGVITIKKLGVHVLQSTDVWIFYPRSVEFEVSGDGKTYEAVGTVRPTKEDLAVTYAETRVLAVENLSKHARYVRVKIERYGTLPDWHIGAGGADGYEGEAWLFLSEIQVNPIP